jgi:hypothetical protein
MSELTPREVLADWIEEELAECVPDPASAATAILERLRDAGFSVCVTEKMDDAAAFLDDIRAAAMRVISSGTIAKARIAMARGQTP